MQTGCATYTYTILHKPTQIKMSDGVCVCGLLIGCWSEQEKASFAFMAYVRNRKTP